MQKHSDQTTQLAPAAVNLSNHPPPTFYSAEVTVLQEKKSAGGSRAIKHSTHVSP